MPQTVQIVPKYQHPHVETYVNDYTTFEDSTSTTAASSGRTYLAVFQSSKGIDNKLVKIESSTDFTYAFGKSDYRYYGQPLMMPIAELESGASVWCMRVMPEDAKYANSVLYLNYKTDSSTGKFIIKFTAKAFTGSEACAASTLTTAALSSKDEDLGAEWTSVPVMLIRANGRGTYGNDYRWRITVNSKLEKEYSIKMFSFEALVSDVSNSLTSAELTSASVLLPTRHEVSTYINDIMDETDKSKYQVEFECLDYNLEDVYTAYSEFVESLPDDLKTSSSIPSLDQFDPFFGLMPLSTSSVLPNIEMSDDEDALKIDNAEGIALLGGNDGDNSETTKTNLYVSAFNGDIDSKILVPRRTPVDALFDASYPFEAKRALAKLAKYREDAILYLDAGTDVTSTSGIETVINDYSTSEFASNYIVKDFQHYTVRDLTSRRRVVVSMTYLYAQKLTAHLDTYGIHKPFVKSYCQLTGHIKDSLEPCIEITDMDLKDKLYTNRFNYFEAIDENLFQRSCQNTAQTANSDLLEESNMRVLIYLKSNLERDCIDDLYNFSSLEDRNRFTRLAMAKYSPMVGVSLESLNIYFDQNEWELERSILHCYVSVTFRGIHKRTIVEIDVNKRSLETE